MNWNFSNDRDLFGALVGSRFGPEPEKKIAEIREFKKIEAYIVLNHLRLNHQDVALDLGSGCGFVGRWVAPKVKLLHCQDISKDFLSFCKRELAGFENVTFEVMTYGKLTNIPDGTVDKIYSTSVFIHFNLFDIVAYFREIWRALRPGGLFLFTFSDSDKLTLSDDPNFNEVLVRYQDRRDLVNFFLQWNSGSTVAALASQCGFETDVLETLIGSTSCMMLRKIGG